MAEERQPDSRGRVSGGTGKKRTTGRVPKRKGFQNKSKRNGPPPKKFKSTSANKVQNKIEVEISNTKFRLIDVNVVYSALQNVICCKLCHGPVEFFEKGFRGLGFRIVVTCIDCEKKNIISSCNKVGTKKNGYEVNRRLVLAMRALGQGYAGSQSFCGIMDLPKPVVHSVYDELNVHLAEACKKIAEESMNTAIQEEVSVLPKGRKGLSASGDGTYRKKGFSSLQGVTSLIGIDCNKVIGRCVKNSYCKGCQQWENRKDTAEYEEWFEAHLESCTANHTGCAGKMEVDGILEILEELLEKGIKIEYYIGDGDSKVYSAIQNLDLYEDELKTSKKECVGHVQKRMGTQLRNLKKSLGNNKLSDGKSIGGQGRLTGKVIDELTVYYGNAIRANSSSSVQEMKNSIWATFHHKSSTDKNPQHHFCPPGRTSWCKYQQAKAEGKESSFKHGNPLPVAVLDVIEPIYVHLTDDSLLQKCLGGFTQNNNESLNNCIWKLVPKTLYSGLTTLEIGVDIAVTIFNEGRVGFLKIMEVFQIYPGKAALNWVKTSNDQRLQFAEKKTLDSTKEARQAMRRLRLGQQEDSYAAGAY